MSKFIYVGKMKIRNVRKPGYLGELGEPVTNHPGSKCQDASKAARAKKKKAEKASRKRNMH